MNRLQISIPLLNRRQLTLSAEGSVGVAGAVVLTVTALLVLAALALTASGANLLSFS